VSELVIVNPGTEAVDNSSEEKAIENIKIFITDLNDSNISFIRIPVFDYGDGRYAFLLWKDNECHEIQMPGKDLHLVRWMDGEDQNIWDFPRLYVDDSSWVWKFAINCFDENEE